jgi:hypothetical protein
MIVHLCIRPRIIGEDNLIRNIYCNNKEYVLDEIGYDNGIHTGINKIDGRLIYDYIIFYTYYKSKVNCPDCSNALMIKDIIE